MEALFSQLSFLADQALLAGDDFDPSKIHDLLALFEQEAYGSWAAAEAELRKEAEFPMREAEDYLHSLMEAANKSGKPPSKTYTDAAMASAVAAMKSAFASSTKSKVHP
ncbi:uncharacterized protein LOC121981641 [Zingiber officinale]|uniref:Uncharacterized protein n=1 Tax=Zingiber officinale TaxID=94328 RepID=A0A8J5L6N6_ZINOF|nr:uncharacterized protein LOC121981641 [Zingiber officinale]KAG6508193.1 hypothetical protein ZIOFF_033564 [Zingiber officinale]